MSWKTLVFGLILTVGGVGLYNAIYTVPEGHVGIVQFAGKADRQEGPGLQYKTPFIEDVQMMEIRQRKLSEAMPAATQNQLPATATVSVNWTVNPESAIDLYRQYGGLSQFEDRVLKPRLRSASKAAIAQYPADQIIRNRNAVVLEIQNGMLDVTTSLPISVNSTQLEDISLPEAYLGAVQSKERAREEAAREQHNLEKQKLQAQQKVQTAEAEADAIEALADANAYKVERLAEAEAYRVKTEYDGRAEGVALLKAELTPEYISYLRAQNWNGVLPQTMLGEQSDVLFAVK